VTAIAEIAPMGQVDPPRPGRDEQFFWDGVARDELLLQYCSRCRTPRMPPGPMCPDCHSLEWEARPASGRATVHSWVVSHHPTEPDPDGRIVALLDLAEGVRLVSNLLCDIGSVRFGLPVELTYRTYGGVRLPQFVPVRR
jgi:uncharacterized protein